MSDKENQIKSFAQKLMMEKPKILHEEAYAKGLKLYQMSLKLRRMYEIECSEPRGEEPAFKARVKGLEHQIDTLMKSMGINYKLQTDPRGSAIRIFWTYQTPPPYNTMGGAEAGWGIG